MTYDDALEYYERCVADWPAQQVKGKANKYTSLNGNMFSFMEKSGRLCLRLGKDDEQAFNTEFGTEPVIQHGSVMRGYVGGPDAFLGQDALAPWWGRCWENAQKLKPKPTKK